MAAAFVALNGTGSFDGTGSVLTFTTTRQIEAGEHVVVLTANNGGSLNTSTITVGALSLSLDKMGPSVNTHIEQWSAPTASLIASGETVTVTLPGSITNSINAICYSLSGIATTSYVDVTATGTGVSQTSLTTSATSVTAQNDEIATAGVRTPNASSTLTATGGYTEIAEINDAVALKSLEASYLVLTATGAQTATWTATGAISTDSLIVVYKGLAGSTGFTNSVPPTVTGALAVGGTLTANPGTWIPTPGSFNYYWHRADDAAATNLVEIGATGGTYTLASADLNKYIRAGVIPNT